ncbi:DNA primase [Ruminococcaceae bacterium OttesenSCG-928-O06]|nr:DNA primase [Ruminococcaceae bacterium OttesenSCG-928-O06]
MAISQEYIAELSRRTDIVELVRSHVQLKRAGRMEKGLCPFHNEKTPSFYVYPETASFYCFGCGAGGDAITFVKQIQNLDYVEAVKFLAARVGMPMPDEDDSLARLRGRMLAINRESAKFYAGLLNTDAAAHARAYLRGRGLADKTIRGFGLGFAPDEFGALRDHMKALGFTEEELVAAGVCKRGAKGGVYDAFRGRVIFPIIDLRGNVIAFGGRSMGEGKGPKYLNSSDTPVFKKSRNLFALNIARKSPQKRLILAEGYMDVISLHQAGFATAVATLGTALTGEQAKLMSDYAEEVVLCYDSDEAGQRATARAIEVLEHTPVKVRVLALAGAKDPDEFITKFGPQRFEALLEGSGNTIEYALGVEKRKQDITTADGKAAYIRAALEVLAAGALPAEQDIYAGRIAEETDVAKAAILTQLEGVVRQRRRRMARQREKRMRDEGAASSVNVPYGAGGAKALGAAFAEQQLVAALLKDPAQFIPLAAASVRPQQMLAPEMAEAYALILEMGEAGEYIDLAALSGKLPERTIALLSRILAQNYDIGFTRQDVEMFLQRIQGATTAQANPAEMSDEELKAHLEQMRKSKKPPGT